MSVAEGARHASREIRCERCGFGAVAERNPLRCPMCGNRSWSVVIPKAGVY
jgi:rubrerythrin